MGRTYYYMRISTAEERGKQKFTRQEKSIQDYCKNQNIEYDEHDVFRDDCSGKTFDRPSWKTVIPWSLKIFLDSQEWTPRKHMRHTWSL